MKSKLKKPKSQTQEVLYELIKNPNGTTRSELMRKYYVLNAPQQIKRLRNYGVEIETIFHHTLNKFGREVKYGAYLLTNRKKAVEIYSKLEF